MKRLMLTLVLLAVVVAVPSNLLAAESGRRPSVQQAAGQGASSEVVELSDRENANWWVLDHLMKVIIIHKMVKNIREYISR